MLNTKVLRKKYNIAGWLQMIPAILGFLVTVLYPIVFSLVLGFTDMKFTTQNLHFIGWENYKWLFDFSVTGGGKEFWHGVLLSFSFAIFSTLLQTFVGFIYGYILYCMTKRLKSIYKVLVYIPAVLPTTAITTLFKLILERNGLMDHILVDWFGFVTTPNYLGTDGLTMVILILINTWRNVGITTIIYLIAMSNMDKEMLESARLDGCNNAQILFRMILPITWWSTVVNVLLSITGGLKAYDFIFVLTGGAGDTKVVGMYIYQTAYEYHTFARAIAMSFMMTLIVGSFTLFVNKLSKKVEDKI